MKFSSTHSRLCGFSVPDTPLVYGGQRWLHLPGCNILAQKSKERSVWGLTKVQIRLWGKGEFCFLFNRTHNLVPFNRRGRGANSPTRLGVLGHSIWYDRVGMDNPSEKHPAFWVQRGASQELTYHCWVEGWDIVRGSGHRLACRGAEVKS